MDWLQSIVEARVTGAIEISSDLERMRSSVPRVNHLMEKAEWWRFKSKYIEHLLKELRHAAYDAEDVLAQYDYYQLQQQIEGNTTNQLVSPLVSFMRNLASNSSSKIKNLRNKLDRICNSLVSELGPLSPPDGSNPYGKALQRETTSLLPDEVFGREELVEKVLKLMLRCCDDAESSNDASSSSEKHAKRRKISTFSILPIVGMGGMGKTTLAQQIYNNERVKNVFDLRIWVCVSDYFDLKKITKEMIESANRELVVNGGLRNNENQFGFRENLENLDSLQQILKEKVASRRYLLVLDDVWHDKARDWEILCNPLRFGNKGSMVLITTRESRVAEIAGTLDPIELAGLPDDILWELFKKCAFYQCEDTSANSELESIGKKIATKLKGCPLAAKTLGGILSVNMTIMHWRNILDSELWQLEHDDESYQAALRVSYQYLPLHLKRCFVMCSLFPKDFSLEQDALGSIWMADGIISHEEYNFNNGKGEQYFADLKRRSFILTHYKYLIHDHMHDLAKSLLLGICYCQEETDWSLRNHNSVRHLSVYRKPIELIEREISKCEKLRSLLFLNDFSSNNETIELRPSTLSSLFNNLPFLRLLDLRNCKIEELSENIGNLKLLFYLDLENTGIRCLPDSFCRLYNLEFINVKGCPIKKFPNMFSKLINLRQIITNFRSMPKISRIGMLTRLEILEEFEVLKAEGHKINELKNMTRLKGWIIISKLENVEGRDAAAQAHLNNKKHLTDLSLEWSPCRDTSSGSGDHVNIDEDTIEGLQPHSNLDYLCIRNYRGRTIPSWLQNEKHPHLSSLEIAGCPNLESVDNCFLSSRRSSLKHLCIRDCVNLLCLPWEWINNSSLSWLKIKNCPQLSCPTNLILPSSLINLDLDSRWVFDKSLSSCLQNSHSLQRLTLINCPHITSLPISQVTDHLRSLTLENCAELQCLEVSNSSPLEWLAIEKCPKLLPPAGPSDADNQEPRGSIEHLSHLWIDNTSLLNLPFLRIPPSSLGSLEIRNSPEERMFVGDARDWFNGHQNLWQLNFYDCYNLESLPEELHTLGKLRYLVIDNCPKIQSLPQNGLPQSLYSLYYRGCHPALTQQLKQLDLAKELQTE